MARWMLVLAAVVSCAACSTDRSAARADWSYRIVRDHGAQAVEVRRGELFFRGRPVPETWAFLLCPLGGFERRTNTGPAARSTGWLREDGEATSFDPGPAGPRLDAAGAARGWYEAPAADRRPGTPAAWVWALLDGRGYWLDARGLFYYTIVMRRERGAR